MKYVVYIAYERKKISSEVRVVYVACFAVRRKERSSEQLHHLHNPSNFVAAHLDARSQENWRRKKLHGLALLEVLTFVELKAKRNFFPSQLSLKWCLQLKYDGRNGGLKYHPPRGFIPDAGFRVIDFLTFYGCEEYQCRWSVNINDSRG